MIDLYSWNTPNGQKIHIMLEEAGLDYRIHRVDIGKGEQLEPAFLTMSPNGKIPAIIDTDGPNGEPLSVFESGAILLYLAEKTGKLLPNGVRERTEVVQWLMFQVGGVGPMLGQAGHFRHAAPEDVPYALERYQTETERLYGVVDRRLADRDFLACDYSIADIACFPWLRCYERLGVDIGAHRNVQRWLNRIELRRAVVRGVAARAS